MTKGLCLHGEVSSGRQCTVGLPGVVFDTHAFSVQHNRCGKLAYPMLGMLAMAGSAAASEAKAGAWARSLQKGLMSIAL